jgi:hypothetical protein
MIELSPNYMQRWANGVHGVWKHEAVLDNLFREAQTALKRKAPPGSEYRDFERRHAPSGQSEFALIAEVVASKVVNEQVDPFRMLVKPVKSKPIKRSALNHKTIGGRYSSAPTVAPAVVPVAPAPTPGYHLATIAKGELGELSKIAEELAEAQDAEAQGVKLMVLVELSDLVGAVEHYLDKHAPGTTLDDLVKMKDVTRRAFSSGRRT